MQPLVIDHTEFLAYKIPFKQPFVFGNHAIHEREGFYLDIATCDGHQARGEIAPLNGRSLENDRRIRHDLKKICSCLTRCQIPPDKDALIAFLRGHEIIGSLCPSVRFGVESVLFLLAAAASGQSLTQFLGADVDEIKTAALLQGDYHQVMADAKTLIQQGYDVFKLKVGDRNIPLDVKKLQDIRNVLPGTARLRLDANSQWSLDEACLFFQLTGPQKIEFIEDPLKDMNDLSQFYQKTHMPVALDETLSSALGQHKGVFAYALKPTILGGIVVTLDWIKEAERLKKKAIISSCFESTVGLKVLAALACLTGQTPGLGTERFKKE